MVAPNSASINFGFLDSKADKEKIHGFNVFVPDQTLGELHWIQESILIGIFEGFSGETEMVRKWVKNNWKVKGKVEVVHLSLCKFLFRFGKPYDAKVLISGCMKMDNFELKLQVEGVLESTKDEAWIIVSDLPMEFWSKNLFRKIGDHCGSFLEIDLSSIYNFDKVRIRIRNKERVSGFVLIKDSHLIRKFFILIEKTSESMKPDQLPEKIRIWQNFEIPDSN